MGTAVKETLSPVQKGFVWADMETPAGSAALTIMTMGPDVTGLPLTHEAFDMTVHVIESPFDGVQV